MGRDLIRWCFRFLMLPMAEWRKAKIDLTAQQSVHQVQADTMAEVQKLRVSLRNLERMHDEAAEVLARHPAAGPVVVDLLRTREQELRRVAQMTPAFEIFEQAAD